MASPVELSNWHKTARGWRAGFVSEGALLVLAAASLRHAKRCRWRLLRIALDVVVVTRPNSTLRIEWRLATLHRTATRERQAAMASCGRLLKVLPKTFANMQPPPHANVELWVANQQSLRSETLEARSRYNAVTLLLRQVTDTRGKSMWKLLRCRAALAYFHILRRLELRLTALTAPPRSLEEVRESAIMCASAAERLLGQAAYLALEIREFQIDPYGWTPRFISRRCIPRDSLVGGHLLQDEAEAAFMCFMDGLRMLC